MAHHRVASLRRSEPTTDVPPPNSQLLAPSSSKATCEQANCSRMYICRLYVYLYARSSCTVSFVLLLAHAGVILAINDSFWHRSLSCLYLLSIQYVLSSYKDSRSRLTIASASIP
jgi:hypothetical protein